MPKLDGKPGTARFRWKANTYKATVDRRHIYDRKPGRHQHQGKGDSKTERDDEAAQEVDRKPGSEERSGDKQDESQSFVEDAVDGSSDHVVPVPPATLRSDSDALHEEEEKDRI